MYYQTTDTQLFNIFWKDESTNTPRFFQDSGNTWTCTREEFQAFCDRCTVYSINDTSLVYVEPDGNLHISVLRGSKVDIDALKSLRDDLLKTFPTLYAYVGTHLRGLAKMLESLGFSFNGVEMRYGHTRNRIFVWQMYVL